MRDGMGAERHRVELSIPMLPEMELAASRTAEAVAEFIKLDADRVDETVMALIEACLYTFQKGKPDERAHVCFCIYEDRLEVYLHTLGEGLEPEKVAEQAEGARPLPPDRKGWGLRIMEALMDRAEVIQLPEGPLIRMVKYRDG